MWAWCLGAEPKWNQFRVGQPVVPVNCAVRATVLISVKREPENRKGPASASPCLFGCGGLQPDPSTRARERPSTQSKGVGADDRRAAAEATRLAVDPYDLTGLGL